MDKHIEAKLQGLINKHWCYGTRVITITGYEVAEDRGRVFIHTNERQNHFDRTLGSIGALIKELTPAVQETRGKQSDLIVASAGSLANDLKKILLDNIEKVKADKEYIPQATVVNNNVNSLINLAKMEMDYLKTAHKFKTEGE